MHATISNAVIAPCGLARCTCICGHIQNSKTFPSIRTHHHCHHHAFPVCFLSRSHHRKNIIQRCLRPFVKNKTGVVRPLTTSYPDTGKDENSLNAKSEGSMTCEDRRGAHNTPLLRILGRIIVPSPTATDRHASGCVDSASCSLPIMSARLMRSTSFGSRRRIEAALSETCISWAYDGVGPSVFPPP